MQQPKSLQLIQLTTEDLQSLLSEVVKTHLEDIKTHLQPKEPNKYLTRQEVAEMLKIDISSVHNWTKKGTLTAHQISGRVYYKLQEVENSIIQLKN